MRGWGQFKRLKNTRANHKFVRPRLFRPFYDAVTSLLASAVRSHNDNFSYCARQIKAVIDPERFYPTTSTCGKERLVDESREAMREGAGEEGDGEEGGEGMGGRAGV